MFEVVAEDLLGRIGKLKTKSGKKIETPAFLPVINPVTQDISARWMDENLKARIVITNAYILYKRLREEALKIGVHRLIDFDGVVMTDSGGYQVLEYGEVEASPEEIALFEEDIKTDIAVPLDVPTGLGSRRFAEESVEKTLKNLEATLKVLSERVVKSALWVGTIQGGVHIDLLKQCAEKIKEMGFDLYALGSPTPLMEGYRFNKLFEMITAARMVIEYGKPLHLFGAGHPMIFPFIVALGVDMFDSASYYLYAKDDRYITEFGTLRLEKMNYLPCVCPVCSKISIDELKELPRKERVNLVAKHNLYVCFKEIAEIKQAIRDGRLIELLEIKARSHPDLYQGFREIMMNDGLLKIMEQHTPLYSRRGLNIFDKISLRRPEIRRAKNRLLENIFKERLGKKAILIPYTLKVSPQKIERILSGRNLSEYDLLLYGSPYGLIPIQIRYVYPFSQTDFPNDLIIEDEVVDSIIQQISSAGYREIIVVEAKNPYLREIINRLVEKLSGRDIEIKVTSLK
ncbi:MAG: tRNA guanosine(15) transglycosylase TgtA [Aigarchaeota archaeon]|nr:tRNA guanosine(15) transglycosylase TgtA [Aigarchaeota archaeon]MDW7986094.1 tRNA guanosine(15) transglycosylase TgtA [Nitrososphaerota archaeon]